MILKDNFAALRCECNGKSRYCLADAWGLRCLDCRQNTEGRHCERCKDGYYHQGAGQSCTPCRCSAIGSVGVACDSRGRCHCKEGVTGDRCDHCPGCTQSRQTRQNSDSDSVPCFCYGHTTQCSDQQGYTVHNITSTFTTGLEGWRALTAQGVAPDDVHYRWSLKYQDIEVISKNSLPVYLYAPASYLGNQLLSFGQTLSFLLRLDRGVRHPSTSDVVLEGSGLRVSASLGDLRSIVPCGQKISYSFRLDQQPGSKWRPQLSPFQFQTLLQNLTAIKIRATFGENGRGYLDDVRLVSARQGGDGIPATWVQSCSCPDAYQGQFCERCSSGYKRRSPSDGVFSPCEPCSCRGGSCDPETGDCFSADETDRHSDCPPGTTGSRCHVCREGFYGDPLGVSGLRRPCRPCRCNGHVDAGVAGNCDRSTGECLKCLNNTSGSQCEECLDGFYHNQLADACKPCDCDVHGSMSRRCSNQGQCRCRGGFEGPRCHRRSDCPSCFGPVKTKMEAYAEKLRELETLFSDVDGGSLPGNSVQMETALRAAEELVTDLQENTDRLAEMERRLQGRLSSISQSQLAEGRDIQTISNLAGDIEQRHQTYETQAADVQTLITEMRRKLEEAKINIQSAEFPLRDAPLSSDVLSTLVQKVTDLADRHQNKADSVERSANEALGESEKSLVLVRTLMNQENNVKQLIGRLKAMYDESSSQVKVLQNQAARLSGEARDESRMADDMLKQMAGVERGIPSGLKVEVDAAVTRLDGLEEEVEENITGYQALQKDVDEDKAHVEELLAQGNAAQQEHDKLLARVNAAKAVTSGALQDINLNLDAVDHALSKLRGFDQQIDGNKALADAAIKKLPAINATIQHAVANNSETLSLLGAVGRDYSDALGSVNLLENLVASLETPPTELIEATPTEHLDAPPNELIEATPTELIEAPTIAKQKMSKRQNNEVMATSGSLPSHAGLLRDATKLNEDLQGLKLQADAAKEDLAAELDKTKRQKAEAEEVSLGATGAYDNAKQTRDAVGQTLQRINNLLGLIGKHMKAGGLDNVDEERLSSLEESLANAQHNISRQLKPRLDDMEEKEAAQRNRLTRMNLDINNILKDIANLEDILKAVPNGCYNLQSSEHA
ncbi:laminin subunit gamma-2 [Diretmus argenteus]